ncbi:MAG: hypothetical protein O3C68_01045 [Proteobacteria bacterium]|nr:hypothetical protein [Pseudomonadota bacterium]
MRLLTDLYGGFKLLFERLGKHHLQTNNKQTNFMANVLLPGSERLAIEFDARS